MSLQDLCRTVYCPVFEALNGSECRSTYSGFEQLHIQVYFHFQEINGTQTYNKTVDELIEDVFSIIRTDMLSQLSFVENETLCMAQVYFKESTVLNSTQSVIEFIVSLRWLSYYSRLVPPGVLKLYQPDIIRLGLRNTSGYFQVQVVDAAVPARPDYYILDTNRGTFYHRGLAKYSICKEPIIISTLIICKRINIPTSEYNISNNDLILMTGETLSLPDAYIITIDYISLCFDDYIAKADQMRRQHTENETIMERITVILSFVCSLVSIACLCITIVTYILFVEMRTIPGKINVSLCATLLVAQLFQQFTIDLTQYKAFCFAFGVIIHYTWAATILWMNIASFNLFRCFSQNNMSRAPGDLNPSLLLYSVYVYGVSLFLIGANVLYSFLVTKGNDFGYGTKLCYISSTVGLLATFVAPAAIVVLANGCFLLITIWRVSKVPKIKRAQMPERNNIPIYLKMSTLTGVCWLFGFLRILSSSDVFEVLFILANASQGLLLMVSFVCNKRVFAFYRGLIHSQR